jgi:hypothetical protein
MQEEFLTLICSSKGKSFATMKVSTRGQSALLHIYYLHKSHTYSNTTYSFLQNVVTVHAAFMAHYSGSFTPHENWYQL